MLTNQFCATLCYIDDSRSAFYKKLIQIDSRISRTTINNHDSNSLLFWNISN